MVQQSRVVLISNTAWNIANFRLGLIKHLMLAGYEVIAVAPSDEYVAAIEESGCRFVSLPMDNKGTNLVSDFVLFCRFIFLFWSIKPKVFLGYTIKPNIYGSLASRLLGIKTINNVTGLGTAFIRENWLTRIVVVLYRLGLAGAHKVFFQNRDDCTMFISKGLVRPDVTEIIPGSGVDTARFASAPETLPCAEPRPFRFLLSARLLWDKGVGEFVEAARGILAKRQDVEFQILGFWDVKNPTAISRQQVDAWEHEGIIHYLGEVADVRSMIAQADCVVLPSYREGTPRSLLEAASMGKPLITTDAVGCRDVVDDGITGYLCRSRDAADLMNKMDKMLSLPFEQRLEMGRKGRNKMIAQFDEQIVINKYLEILNELLIVS